MADYKQLDEFLGEKLEKDIEITRIWPEEEIREIGEAVTAMVGQIVQSAMDNDQIFKRLREIAENQKTRTGTNAQLTAGTASATGTERGIFELIPVGSVEEGTKIGQPNERDILLMLNVFSNFKMIVSDTVYGEKNSVYKYVYLDEEDPHTEDIYKVLREQTLVEKNSEGSYVLISAGLSSYFHALLKIAYTQAVNPACNITKQTGQLKAMETKGDMMVEMGKFTDEIKTVGPQAVIERAGPAITLTFLWKSNDINRHTLVDVDIVPNIVVKRPADARVDVDLLFGKYKAIEEIHLIPVKKVSSLNRYARKGLGFDKQKRHMLSFLHSHSSMEVQMMKDLQSNCRLAYKVLKHYTQKQFHCSCCKPSSYTFGFIIQSYLLKTMVIRHGHESSSCMHSGISECVICILSEFREMAQHRNLSLTSLWNKDHNLFNTKPVSQLQHHKPEEWAKEIAGFEKHLSYLQDRFEEINKDDTYTFEMYRNFHLKISNRQRRAEKQLQ